MRVYTMAMTVTLPDAPAFLQDGDAIERLLDRVASLGLSEACDLGGMPGRRTVLRWARESPGFRTQLDAAVSDYAQRLLDEAIEAADSAECRETAAVAKVKVDARLKVAALIAPRVYGREAGGGVDAGGVVVQLLRLAAQGIQDRRLLEAEAVKPQLHDDSAYTARASEVIGSLNAASGVAAASGGADPGGGAKGSGATDGWGSPTPPSATFPSQPTHTPGTQNIVGIQKTARDRIVVEVDETLPDFFQGVDTETGLTPVPDYDLPALPE